MTSLVAENIKIFAITRAGKHFGSVMSFKLVIANKNYSSWSMRPWVLLTEFGIPFDEVMLKFHSAEWDRELPLWSPSKLVPVLWNGEPTELPTPGQASWKSTAIFETVAETFPQHAIWPRDAAARNHARSIVAEMHAGFRPLRTHMPIDRKSTRLNSSHVSQSRIPSSA